MCAIIADARIETERLILRPPRPDDAAILADRINDYDIARMTTRVPHPYALADAEAFLEDRAVADPARERVFMIEHKQLGLAGTVGFHEPQLAWAPAGCGLSPEIGYWLARPFWGRGLATEAAGAALGWAREAWGVRAVASGHFADNPASGRVLDKLGFLYTGEVQQRPSRARGAVAPTRMMVWLA